MDITLFLFLVVLISIITAVLILMNTSILSNQGLRETWRELRETYFGSSAHLDDTPNPQLKDIDYDDAEETIGAKTENHE